MSFILLLSLLVDTAMGEPPNRLHPVVWMGAYLKWMKSRSSAQRWHAFWQGLGLLSLGLVIVASSGLATVYLIGFLPRWLELILLALLLKPMFSLRALLDAGGEVKKALERSDLPGARRLLSWHLVSRKTNNLTEAEVAGATIESLAENLSDSIVAPLLYFAVFGLPGAAVYRFINTADAVLGYRTSELEYFGKSAARLDDLLNLLPARVSAVLLCLALWLLRKDVRSAWHVMWRDAQATPSPNAGWTMAAVAGGLGVRLNKRNIYALNPTGRSPNARDVAITQCLIVTATVLGVVAVMGFQYA